MQALDGRTISFFADGEPIGTDVTEGGAASLVLSKSLRKGSHTFTAEFTGEVVVENNAFIRNTGIAGGVEAFGGGGDAFLS